MTNLLEDIKFSLRLLRKAPAFTAICLIVISLSLAVAISNYSLVQDFRKAPPFEQGERFVGIRVSDAATGEPKNWNHFNAFAFNHIQSRQQSFEQLGAGEHKVVNLATESFTKRFYISNLTPNALSSTGVQSLLGRLLTEDDSSLVGDPVVVISHNLWQQEFLGDPGIIGRSVELDGQAHNIVGVMPEDFIYPYPQDLWRPLAITSSAAINGNERLGLIGKLKPGVSREEATREVNQLIANLAEDMPQALGNIEAEVVSTRSVLSGGAGNIGPLFDALTIVIFLLASLNLSTLLFTRANERTQELAVRNALGASAWQLRKQVLLESGLLCLIGCGLAFALAAPLLSFTQLVMNLAMDSLGSPMFTDIGLHLNSVLYGIAMGTIIWLLSSAITVYKISGARLHSSLDSASKGATSRSRTLTMRTIVSIEVIFSFFLLMVCGLINFSILKSYQIDFGSSGANLYIAEFSFPRDDYHTIAEQNQSYQILQNELEGQVDIDSVSFTNSPAGGWNWPNVYPISIPDRDLRTDEKYPEAITGAVSATFFQDTNVDIVSGRDFDGGDKQNSLPVVIVDARLADKLWPNETAIGKQIQLNPNNTGPLLTVVGINAPIIHGQPLGNLAERYAIYRPITQHPVAGRAYITIKTNKAIALPELQQRVSSAFKGLDRAIALNSPLTYQDFMESSLLINDFLGQVFTWFSFVTLCLSVIGVYAIIARSVTLGTREIGIRQALGASKARVIKLFLSQGGLYLFVGTIIGGGAALFISPFMTVLFTDILEGLPLVSVTVLLALGTLIFLACYLPTKQAISIEPGDALREE